MKKFSAIACTIGFATFWIFGGLAAVSLVNGDPVGVVVPALCALGLAVGVVMRLRVVAMTRDLPQGTRAVQHEPTTA